MKLEYWIAQWMEIVTSTFKIDALVQLKILPDWFRLPSKSVLTRFFHTRYSCRTHLGLLQKSHEISGSSGRK